MKVLLDTHAFLWFFGGSSQLSPVARTIIEDDANTVFLSLVSLWELAIKTSLGKFRLGQPFEQFILQQLTPNDITLLDITFRHIAVVATLPLHHRDPFDRLLIAQAMVERVPLISADTAFDAYAVRRIW
jgi:PIN domain nuclease of toxin-antitoxin system